MQEEKKKSSQNISETFQTMKRLASEMRDFERDWIREREIMEVV